ncbi:bifunctional glutamate N-acetyltransferase/amino-acid acetyltransferase ArgJ [Heyndrickxia acidiproducens]|uniref:bifunctional glutamate N-acetyltransferase/amino-acid acetyltransferase ArgJ n=1 Tax=Heyndrickxia acidiproducens TaxID=1121084 RepID=UPI000364F521|nr:bifunctional glutamate N-acetyltransferase/amino-acid acetyltransferase ArgJ [Heyndrickxia acidiproducens]
MNQVHEKATTEIYNKTDGNIMSPAGFYAGGLHCGIKKKRPDLAWLYSEVPAKAAGIYTTNQFQAAPIRVTKESLEAGHQLQGLIVNSGNANSFTGEQGLHHAYLMREWFASHLGVEKSLIGVSSTGVIGELLPIEKIEAGISNIVPGKNQADFRVFEKAILTTDTFAKRACATVEIDGKTVTIAGAAKGSGMIHPNMATMLAFVTTDAEMEAQTLQLALKQAADETFNMITVDGDTSTNDMVVAMANGMAGNHPLSVAHPDWNRFYQAFAYICETLAKQIARDGEGATKLVEAKVTGARTNEEAGIVSKTIIGSNLVKTAIFGADANWGRIINAIGYSGVKVEPQKLTIKLGDITVVENGMPCFYSEEEAHAYLAGRDEIQILVDLQDGAGEKAAWGCDLTYDYVKINASYRT